MVLILITNFKNKLLGSDKDYDYCQSQLEMVTLLCVSDKTHSQLMELMPERCGSGTQNNTTTTTTTASTSGNSASETLPSLNQQSPPPSTRDFETVLQAVCLNLFILNNKI